jgi:hypothetical protein
MSQREEILFKESNIDMLLFTLISHSLFLHIYLFISRCLQKENIEDEMQIFFLQIIFSIVWILDPVCLFINLFIHLFKNIPDWPWKHCPASVSWKLGLHMFLAL